MATLESVTTSNKKAGSVTLDPVVFEAPIRPHLFHAEVRRQLALRRAGTHSTRNRAGVSGGGAKPYRQKGTGRARQGTVRAPQFAGGGSVFGPVPRKYEHKLPKKMRRAALRGALSQRVQEGSVTVLDALSLGEFKTRRIREMLESLQLAGKSVLIVLSAPDAHVEASARNLPRVGVIRAEGLNVYDVLRHSHLILTQESAAAVSKRLGDAQGETA